MASTGKKVFLIGPGYIGRCVLDELLKDGYDVTTMVRRETAAKELEQPGLKCVFGDLGDKELISRQTQASDIVIHTASADDMPSVEAVLDGIRQRAASEQHTIYLHTSGTSFLSDDSRSAYASDTIYRDTQPADLDARPDSASHRGIDLKILAARRELQGKAAIFIILPPLIFGVAEKHMRLSIQVPTMVRFAIKHRYAGHVGQGKAIWSTVHVSDLARAYATILHWAETADAGKDPNPYFFCENGEEISWGSIADLIGRGLQPLGKIDSTEPREIPESEWNDLFGPYSAVVIGANSRSRAERVRQLGWTPRERNIREAFQHEELAYLFLEKEEFSGYARPAASGATG